MRKIYIFVIVSFVVSLLIFMLSFVYLDREKHNAYYYTVNLEGRDIGTIKVDNFQTEDKIIYDSVANMPFQHIFTETRSRITTDRHYNLESYIKEQYGSGAVELVYLENKKDTVSFLARFKSRFAYCDNIPIKKGTFVFEEDSPVTYLPLIANYNFRMGRSQGFNALSCFSISALPPMKRFVTFTSIRNEYLKIDSKNIKCENLILKIKNYPQGSIWVSRSDKSLVMLEIPEKRLKITRTFSPKTLEAKGYIPFTSEYLSKEVVLKGKGGKLVGTMTIPRKEGRTPAVLLVWGSGRQDRYYYGFFTSIADYLSKNGFCVLSLDKRGIGASDGNPYLYTNADEVEDINSALGYLVHQQNVDPQKIAIISHGEGVIPSSNICQGKNIVKALVLMAPSLYQEAIGADSPQVLGRMASNYKWKEDYTNLVTKSIQDTKEKVKNSKFDRIYLSGRVCFAKNMRTENVEEVIGDIKKIKIPVLILQGKEDDDIFIKSTSIIDKSLEASGNRDHTLTYYGYLAHFFGQAVNDGVHKIHYMVDKDVLETIGKWLNKNLVEAASPDPVIQPSSQT